jgi:hypothetical protein
MTSCAPVSSLAAGSLHNTALLGHNASSTDQASFENCCVKVSGAYTSPEGDCYSHCYYYSSATATRLKSCFHPNSTLDFRIFTDNTTASSASSSKPSVVTSSPVSQSSVWVLNISRPSNTSSYATASSYTIANYTSSSNWTVPTTSAPVQTSTTVISNGTYTNATVTGNVIITATGSPTIPPQPTGTSAPASSSTKPGSKAASGARVSLGTIAVVGLAFVALFA